MYRNVVQSMVFFSSDLLSYFLGLCKNWTGLQSRVGLKDCRVA